MTEEKKLNPVANGIKKYLVTQLIDPTVNWMDIKGLDKLAFIQKTPKTAVKKRMISNKEIPYVEIDFVEKAVEKNYFYLSPIERNYIFIDILEKPVKRSDFILEKPKKQ